MEKIKSFQTISKKLQDLKEQCPKNIDVSFDLVKTNIYYMDISKEHRFNLKKSFRLKDLIIDIPKKDEKKAIELIKEFKLILNKHLIEINSKFDFSFNFPNSYYLLNHIIAFEVTSISSINYEIKEKVNLNSNCNHYQIEIKNTRNIEKISSEQNSLIVFFLFLEIEMIKSFNFFLILDLLKKNDSDTYINIFLFSHNISFKFSQLINDFKNYIKDFFVSQNIEQLNNNLKLFLIHDIIKFKLHNLIDLSGNAILYTTNRSFRIIDILKSDQIKSCLNNKKLLHYLNEIKNRKVPENELQLHEQDLTNKMTSDDDKIEFHSIGLEVGVKKSLINNDESHFKTLTEESSEVCELDENFISKKKIKELKTFLINYNSKHHLNFQQDMLQKNLNFIEITYDKITSFSEFNSYNSEVKIPKIIFALNNRNKFIIDTLKKSLKSASLLKSVMFSGYYYSSNFIINIFLKVYRKIRKTLDNVFISKIKANINKFYEFRKQGTVIKHIKISNKMKLELNDVEKYKKLYKCLKEVKTFFSYKNLIRFNYSYHIDFKLLPSIQELEYFYFPQQIKVFKLSESHNINFTPNDEPNYAFNLLDKNKLQFIIIINLLNQKFLNEDFLNIIRIVHQSIRIIILFIGEENEVKSILANYHESFGFFSHNNFNFFLLDSGLRDQDSYVLAKIYAYIYETKSITYSPYDRINNNNVNLYIVENKKVIFSSNELDKMKFKISEFIRVGEYKFSNKKDFSKYVEYEKITEKALKKSFNDLCKNIDNFYFVKTCKFRFLIETNFLVSPDFKEMLSKKIKKPQIFLNFHELDLTIINKMIQDTIFTVLPQEDFLIEHCIKSNKSLIKVGSICHLCKDILISYSFYFCSTCKQCFCQSCGCAEHPHLIYVPYKNLKDKMKMILFGKVFSEIKPSEGDYCHGCCKVF